MPRESYRESSRDSGRDRDEGRGRGRDRDDDRGRDRDEGRGRGRDRDDDRGSRGGSRYQYEGRQASDVNRRAEGGAKDYDKYLSSDVKGWKPNDKDNTIRVIPPTWPKPKHYGYDIWVHYGIGPDRQAYLCLHKMEKEALAYADRIEKTDPELAKKIRDSAGDCPICRERQKAVDEGDEKYAKELEPKRRVLTYLIDRDNEREGLQAWAMPWTVDRDICAVSVEKRSGEVLPIDHPEEGYDIEFEKKGAKDRTEYVGIRIARRESSLGNSKWLDEAMDLPLPDTLVFYPSDHIKSAFGGGSARDERDRDDDRGGRDRGRDRDDDRGRGRDRDDDRGGRRRDEPTHTWESIHKLEGPELDKLVDDEGLDLDPRNFKSDEDLAEAICLKLDLEEPRTRDEGRGRGRDEPEGRSRGRDAEPEGRRREPEEGRRRDSREEPEGRARLDEMRRRRERD